MTIKNTIIIKEFIKDIRQKNKTYYTVDLPKTILNLLNVRKKLIPENLQGYDISSILTVPKNKVRRQILIEHDEEIAQDTVFRLRTLITEQHRLTLYDGYEDIGDIFDLKNDSDELNNLWSMDKELKNSLLEKLLREIISVRPRTPKRNAYN